MTNAGTTNNHGLIVMAELMASNITWVSVTPLVSIFKPIIIKAISVIMIVGVVVINI